MKIGIVGGTGDIGEGMGLRLSPVFDVVVGSREKDKAEMSCKMGRETLHSRGKTCSLTGVSNQDAIDSADIIVLAIPFRHLAGTLEGLHGFEDKIVAHDATAQIVDDIGSTSGAHSAKGVRTYSLSSYRAGAPVRSRCSRGLPRITAALPQASPHSYVVAQ